jgi:hypothetical protein
MNTYKSIAFRAILVVSTTLLVPAGPLLAQAGGASPASDEQKLDQQIDLIRKDVRSQKKQIIAANLKLTDKEAEQFWPIYDKYTADLVKVNDTKYSLIKQYAAHFDNMNDADLDKSAKEWLALDQDVASLRLKYFPMFRKVLSAKNTALLYQLDRRLVNMIDLQVASVLPLIEP